MSKWSTGPLQPFLPVGEVHVWRIPLGDKGQLAICRSLLSPEEHLRAARFVFEKDRERYLMAHGALRQILARYLACPPQAISFTTGPHGKPCLRSPLADLRFNLSHSGEMILIALSRNREVGVDVEHVNEELQFEQIATHCFDPREVWELRIAPPKERVTRFFDTWTRMEAKLKADGTGIGGEIRDPRWCARNLQPAQGYAGAVASEGDDWRLACWEWSW